MARNIKKIAHDLTPLSDAITELSSIMSQLLNTLVPYVKFDNSEAERYFSECSNACEKMALSAKLIKKYVEDVHNEADKEGITKN